MTIRSFAALTSVASQVPRSLEQRRSFIQHFLARGFLLGVNLRARLLQRFLILLHFFSSGRLRGFRGLLRAGGTLFALRHHGEQRLEKQRFQDEIKDDQDQDCGHSPEEEFA